MYFNRTKSDILLCGIARFSLGNKNKLRTFQPRKGKRIKHNQPRQNLLVLIKKECDWIQRSESKKFFGVFLDEKLEWKEHAKYTDYKKYWHYI